MRGATDLNVAPCFQVCKQCPFRQVSSVPAPQQNYTFIFVPKVDEKRESEALIFSSKLSHSSFLLKQVRFVLHRRRLHSYMTDKAMLKRCDLMLPDQGCAPVGSCHNGLPPRLCRYLSGPHCKHMGSCRSRSKYLLSQNMLILVFRTVRMLFKGEEMR